MLFNLKKTIFIFIVFLILFVCGCKESIISKEYVEDTAKYIITTNMILPFGAKPLRDYSSLGLPDTAIQEAKNDMITSKIILSDKKWCITIKYYYLINETKVENERSLLFDLKKEVSLEKLRAAEFERNDINLINVEEGTIQFVDDCNK